MSSDILNHPLISERYFFPRREGLDDPFWVDCGDARLACYYRRRYERGRTVVFFHGNGEIVPDYLNGFVEVFDRLGYNCLLAEYRGYGFSTGRPELGVLLEDVETILRATGEVPERLVLFGRSVGSLFAIHGVSLWPRIGGLILESAVADVLERLLLRVRPEEMGIGMGDFRVAVAERLDHRTKLQSFSGPVLVLHGEGDELVDVSHAHRLYQWAGGPKKMKIFPRGGHNDLAFVNAPEYFALVGEFLKNL